MENLLIPYQATTTIPCNKALVFAPHPDDEVFGCGGTIMRHLEQGKVVEVIIVSDGAYGAESVEARNQYTLQRQEESQSAAKILGYGAPVFWSYPDRKVSYGEKLIQDILAAIEHSQADLIYTPSIFEVHPDHRSIGMAVIEAVRRMGKSLRLALYEVGMPMRPNCLLDISQFVERKMAAMQCFSSQNQKQRYDLDIAALNRYRTYTLPPEIEAAEAYMIISAEELAKDPLKLYQSEYARQKELGLPIDQSDIPLVSVIIRSMDRPTLTRALDSLALQTYPNIEVLVVNAKGGLHTEIGSRCGRFPLTLINQAGMPLTRSQAGNTGLTCVCGVFLSFLDDDDTFDPDHFSCLLSAYKESGEGTMVYSAIRCIDRSDPERKILNVFSDCYEEGKLLAGNFIPIHAPLVPTQIVRQKQICFDESLDVYEDWDFWLQIEKHLHFVLINQVTATYYLGGSSGTNPLIVNKELMYQATLLIYKKWLPLMTAKELWRISRLYHLRNSTLHQSYRDRAILEEKLTQAEGKLTQAEGRIRQKQDELAIIYKSYSWKITEPLRKLRQWLRI